MKTLASAAVEQINAQNLENAKAKAVVLVKDISGLLETVAARESDIDDLQKSLDELSNSELSLSKVMGKPMGTTLNQTQTTIAKAIEMLVKSKQDCVESRAKSLGEAIISNQKSIEALDEAIGKKRKELEDLKVEVVVEADVLN